MGLSILPLYCVELVQSATSTLNHDMLLSLTLQHKTREVDEDCVYFQSRWSRIKYSFSRNFSLPARLETLLPRESRNLTKEGWCLLWSHDSAERIGDKAQCDWGNDPLAYILLIMTPQNENKLKVELTIPLPLPPTWPEWTSDPVANDKL